MKFLSAAQATIFVGAMLLFCVSSVFAQDELSEEAETEQSPDPCLKSETAPSECIPVSPRVIVEELVCTAGDNGVARFQLCNQEVFPVTALSIDPSGQNFAEQITPSLPTTIRPESCINVMVKGIDRKDTINNCNPESKFCMKAYAREKKPGFDCSGDYGFGYDFETESYLIHGKSGFVSLYDPKTTDEENDRQDPPIIP